MIEVKIYKNDKNLFYRYKVEGHSNYDIYGKDIVCAGVSALSQTIFLALNEICNLKYSIDDEKGYMDVFILDKNLNKKEIQILFKAFEIGIKSIQESYPKHVRTMFLD